MILAIAAAGLLTGLSMAALAWHALRKSNAGPLGEAMHHFRAIADGDLSRSIEVRSRDKMGQMMEDLRMMQSRLHDAMISVRDGAQSISTATAQISAGNTDLSQRTEEQAASLEETASSMAELTSTVRQNADNAASGERSRADRGGRCARRQRRRLSSRYDDGRNQRELEADCRHHWRDRGHRVPDQYPRIEPRR
jgi:methyl-accepting chemotaxis protein